MTNESFDPIQFYSSYPTEVIARPGYPARAALKSTVAFRMFSKYLYDDIGEIKNYADIGGCFGFGANSMAFQITEKQKKAPNCFVFEISPGFVQIGQQLFPHIRFMESLFSDFDDEDITFDLVSLFDVVEHIVNPGDILSDVAKKARYVTLITPTETNGFIRGNKPPTQQGADHIDGHVNFFTPTSYLNLLRESGLSVVSGKFMYYIAPHSSMEAVLPEHKGKTFAETIRRPKNVLEFMIHRAPFVPWLWKRAFVGGGLHISLCKSDFF